MIPRANAICQIFSKGETFHARSKVWRTAQQVRGFDAYAPLEPYYSPLNRERLVPQLLHYKKSHSILLKSSTLPVLELPLAFRPLVQVNYRVPFGYNLYIRGDSAGLSWGKGKALTQTDPGQWSFRFSHEFNQVQFKILVNDVHWEEGENHNILNGTETQFTPISVTPVFKQEAIDKQLLAADNGTRISVRYNTGFGKSLTIRGQGVAGLSWQKGLSLKPIDSDLWVWESKDHFGEMQYKLLINDEIWEKGPNRLAMYHMPEEVLPQF